MRSKSASEGPKPSATGRAKPARSDCGQIAPWAQLTPVLDGFASPAGKLNSHFMKRQIIADDGKRGGAQAQHGAPTSKEV